VSLLKAIYNGGPIDRRRHTHSKSRRMVKRSIVIIPYHGKAIQFTGPMYLA
jgi:hypothetical protein